MKPSRRRTLPSGNRMRLGVAFGTVAGWVVAVTVLPDQMVGGYEAGFTVTMLGAWLGLTLAISLEK